jgi:hypothetical protein
LLLKETNSYTKICSPCASRGSRDFTAWHSAFN